MFRTEVVKSKNLRKSTAFKISNAVALFILLFIVLLSTNIFGSESFIVQWINENYKTIVSPVIMGLALVIIIFSIVTSSLVRAPQRLGTIEIDTEEIRYLEHDEVVETIQIIDISKVVFEFYSHRMRGNPAGCMNYLMLKTKKETKIFEIVVGNQLQKSELGDVLLRINNTVPVFIKYAYFLKKLFKDKDFKQLKSI